MRFLISNDDGVFSPGLLALAEAARPFGEVLIVAPDVEQSSMSHAITSSRPLSFHEAQVGDFRAYRVNGTPADCVALGSHLWEGEIDAVLSGVNLGLNLGNALWHSGTLAAAKQAALLGMQGIAFSAPVVRGGKEHLFGAGPGSSEEPPDYSRLQPWIERVLERVIGDAELPLVNVNLPSEPEGIVWTRQSVRHYDGQVVPAEDPMGRRHYWFIVRPIEEVEEGTDRWAVRAGSVAVTPLRLDLTSAEGLESARRRHPFDDPPGEVT